MTHDPRRRATTSRALPRRHLAQPPQDLGSREDTSSTPTPGQHPKPCAPPSRFSPRCRTLQNSLALTATTSTRPWAGHNDDPRDRRGFASSPELPLDDAARPSSAYTHGTRLAPPSRPLCPHGPARGRTRRSGRRGPGDPTRSTHPRNAVKINAQATAVDHGPGRAVPRAAYRVRPSCARCGQPRRRGHASGLRRRLGSAMALPRERSKKKARVSTAAVSIGRGLRGEGRGARGDREVRHARRAAMVTIGGEVGAARPPHCGYPVSTPSSHLRGAGERR